MDLNSMPGFFKMNGSYNSQNALPNWESDADLFFSIVNQRLTVEFYLGIWLTQNETTATCKIQQIQNEILLCSKEK
jgi:hypothetical protein